MRARPLVHSACVNRVQRRFHPERYDISIALQSKLAFLSVMSVAFAMPAAPAPPPENPLASFKISAPQSTVKSGTPLIVKLSLTNTSDHDLSWTVGGPKPPVKVVVKNGNDKEVLETPYGLEVHGNGPHPLPFRGSVSMGILKPGATYGEETDVAKQYDLSKPGVYTIQMLWHENVTHTWMKSNSITVTVTN
jgi:hypothetical protein